MERTKRDCPSRRRAHTAGKTNDSAAVDNSLGVLAGKFFELVGNSPDRSVELNDVAETLKAKKRRVYDITNVLEGVDLVTKCCKNTMTWIGTSAFAREEEDESTMALRQRVADLEEAVRNADEEIRAVLEALAEQEETKGGQPQCYIRLCDLQQITPLIDSNAFVVTGPRSTELLTPRVPNLKRPWQRSGWDPPTGDGRLTFVSLDGPLDVTLFNVNSFQKSQLHEHSSSMTSETISLCSMSMPGMQSSRK